MTDSPGRAVLSALHFSLCQPSQVGLLLSSPIFAEGSKHLNAFRLLAIGLTVWVLACAGAGLAPSKHISDSATLSMVCWYGTSTLQLT